VEYGKDGEELTIPRISFPEGEEVVALVSNMMAQDAKAAIQVVGMSFQQKAQGADAKAYDALGKSLEQLMQKVLKYKLFGFVKVVLHKLSSGVVTDEVLKKMQFTEAVGLMQYLIDENLMPLKNSFASLEAITSSDK
jgi:hypothetical protein